MVRKTLYSLLMIGSFAAAPAAFAEGTASDPATTGTGSGMGTGSTSEECITEEQKQSQYCQDLMRNQGGMGSGSTTSPGTTDPSTGSGTGTGTDSTMPESSTSPTTP